MKKLIYLSSIFVLSFVFCNTTFAYNYYNDPTSYSNEQYRKDIKSYLDQQTQRQNAQDSINAQQKIIDGARRNGEEILNNLRKI